MTDEKKKFVHELRAAPFILDRPWMTPDVLDTHSGHVVVLGDDHVERDGMRHGDGSLDCPACPEGVKITHWRLP
jgi:hypothetical protein